jgi:hypothetical protein
MPSIAFATALALAGATGRSGLREFGIIAGQTHEISRLKPALSRKTAAARSERKWRAHQPLGAGAGLLLLSLVHHGEPKIDPADLMRYTFSAD